MIQDFFIMHILYIQLHLWRLLTPGEPGGVLPVEVDGLARGHLGDEAGNADQQPQSSGRHPGRAEGE